MSALVGGDSRRSMIQVMVFDLDGTLVQTEKLKDQSYALNGGKK